MWNGVFDFPEVVKHRDYMHSTFYEHIKANGGEVNIGEEVPVAVEPITGELMDETAPYYEVEVKLPDGEEYIYLIESDTPGPPSEEEIEDQLQEYIKNKIPEGRRVSDYVAIEVEGISLPSPRTNRYSGRFLLSEVMNFLERENISA